MVGKSLDEMILFPTEEVQHEENDERYPRKEESCQHDCQLRLPVFVSDFQILDTLAATIQSWRP